MCEEGTTPPGAAPTMDVDAALNELLTLARAGDQGARDTLLKKSAQISARAAVRHLARSRECGELVKDVVQEVLIRVYGNLERCQAHSSAQYAAWVLAITRRVILDIYRVPWAAASAYTAVGRLDAEDERRLAWDPWVEPDHPDEHARLLKTAFACYNDLPDAPAALFWWHLVAGLTWPEVGQLLAVTPSSAKRRYQRALTALRRDAERRLKGTPGRSPYTG
jgi:RNA polymerase sigma factor (sigma-70 family)